MQVSGQNHPNMLSPDFSIFSLCCYLQSLLFEHEKISKLSCGEGEVRARKPNTNEFGREVGFERQGIMSIFRQQMKFQGTETPFVLDMTY
jgi:hypothetical protein